MNRRTLLAIVGGTLAVVLLWWFAILSPKRSATSTARAEADAAVARGQELEQTLARLRELDRNRPQIEADLRALNAAIPATPDLATFILSANEIAASSGARGGLSPGLYWLRLRTEDGTRTHRFVLMH